VDEVFFLDSCFPVVTISMLSGVCGVLADVEAVVADIGVNGVLVGDRFCTEPGLAGHGLNRPSGLV